MLFELKNPGHLEPLSSQKRVKIEFTFMDQILNFRKGRPETVRYNFKKEINLIRRTLKVRLSFNETKKITKLIKEN